MRVLRWKRALLAASAALMLPLGHEASALAAADGQQARPAPAQLDAFSPQIQIAIANAVASVVSVVSNVGTIAGSCTSSGSAIAMANALAQVSSLVGNALAAANSSSATAGGCAAIAEPLTRILRVMDDAVVTSGCGQAGAESLAASTARARIAVENMRSLCAGG